MTEFTDKLAERAKRRKAAIQRWLVGQGAKIKQLKPYPVYAACMMLAMERCGEDDWQHSATETTAGWEGLTMKQVQMCEERAHSTWRVRLHGKPPADNAVWDEQNRQVRAEWANPRAEEAA